MGRALGKDNYMIYQRYSGLGPNKVDAFKEKGVI
jgi:hypothetical protein